MRDGFPAGSTGVVVSLYRSGPACEVEVWDEIGYPADTVIVNDIRNFRIGGRQCMPIG